MDITLEMLQKGIELLFKNQELKFPQLKSTYVDAHEDAEAVVILDESYNENGEELIALQTLVSIDEWHVIVAHLSTEDPSKQMLLRSEELDALIMTRLWYLVQTQKENKE